MACIALPTTALILDVIITIIENETIISEFVLTCNEAMMPYT